MKPENVLLDGDRSVLVDFNAIREASEKKEYDNDTRILGTVGYAPPEQYGLSQTDRRADIFALGILINVLLTGKHRTIAALVLASFTAALILFLLWQIHLCAAAGERSVLSGCSARPF